MRRSRMAAACAAGLSAFALAGAAQAQGYERPKVNDDGSVIVPSFALPFSTLASPEAKAAFIAGQKTPVPIAVLPPGTPMAEIRKAMDDGFFAPLIAKLNARYAVTMTPETIGGIYTEVFVPKAGVDPKNKDRVLINLHGGGFIIGARSQSHIESIPIAAVGRIKVISVDYRMGPEHQFPAASEDVATVYKALLKTHKPQNIGIYGCSAGGALTGQAMAWFQKEGLPNPAAIGIFCASTRGFGEGDSAYVTPRLGGALPPPGPGGSVRDPYLGKADPKDPLYAPSSSPVVLAKFPPTLLITGTRAGEMSLAVRSHLDLIKAGVDARLFVWDGLDHGFFGDPDLPESRDAYEVIVAFFGERLGKAAR